MSTKTLGLKVDEETQERPKSLALVRDRTPHYLLKRALLQYLDREEQVERERAEDQERWDRFALTGEAIPHEAVRSWLSALARGEDAEKPG